MASEKVKHCKNPSCRKSNKALSLDYFYIKRRIGSVVYHDSLCKDCRNKKKKLSQDEATLQGPRSVSSCTETETTKEFLCNDEAFQNVVIVVKTLSQWFKEFNGIDT